ncbi:hypothetical protein [Nocardiopsis kunsanensis]|uniref:Uncharacterized protein n=1 Tax=Nocardiopsis kunsanensis TaxID=141693 RepID=A0A918X6L8_9ACTN|nr:hypothetical protein [Nocardiopsis kunsanensis]GHD14853.1 hypothetical protein GCM10007147_01340 [Nocardiopsis kunsanensis]
MALFKRGIPDSVRSRLGRGERVLAHAPVATEAGGDRALTATTEALHLPGGRRVPWSDIDQARWSTGAMTFVEEGAGNHSIPLRSPESPEGAVDYRRLAETVSERVTSTILVNRFVPYPDGNADSGFRLVARRSPGGTDVHWRVHLGEGMDSADPRLTDAVSRALASLREQMGV